MDQIQQDVRRFLTENFAIDESRAPLDAGESLIQSGVVDSTGLLELVSFVETRYGLEVPDEDLLPEHFETIANITAYVDARLSSTAVADARP